MRTLSLDMLLAASRAVLDLVYPARCAGCGHRGDWVCSACQQKTLTIDPPLCGRCGSGSSMPCRCNELSPDLDLVRSVAFYDGWVRSAISSFKYEGERARAEHLALLAIPLLADIPRPISLVPVPLHRSRQRRRGYNQAELLASVIGRAVGLEVDMVIQRAVATRQQVGLSADERATNVKGAFALATDVAIHGRRFVLVDDVMTTGSTLGACAESLKAGGAIWVGAVTIARDR
jgi:ComF family protein